MKKKICKYCGKEYEPKQAAQKYCSDECKKYGFWEEHGKPVCKICGKPVYTGNKTCSPECLKKSQIKFNSMGNPETREKIKQTLVKKYGSWENYKKYLGERTKQISLEKYGTSSMFDAPGAREKIKQTSLEKYGCEDPRSSKQCKEKREETIKKTGVSGRFHTKEWNEAMLKKYGTTVPYKNEDIKQKGINTLLEKYGITSPTKLDWVQEKSKKACLEKYGVEYSFQSENNKTKTRITMLEKYGVEHACFLDNDNKKYTRISKLNKKFGDDLGLLDENYEFTFDRKHYYDFIINNVLVELNPTFTHNSDEAPIYSKDKVPVSKDYHYERMKLANQNGYSVFNVWDWDDIDKVKKFFSKKKVIGARKCEAALIEKETSDNFLEENHFQGKCEGDRIRIGLVYQNELVGIMTFGAPRYSTKAEIELLRLCFKLDTVIIGGSEKMFKFLINNYNPSSIISYCDKSKFSGKVYENLGFKLVNEGKPSAHWSKGKNHITDNLLRQRGYDSLFGTDYGKDTSNEQLMLSNGWRRVYDCGQETYIWNNK